MIILQDSDIQTIESQLRRAGVSEKALRGELLDHVCCLIESDQESRDFEEALENALEVFGKDHLPQIQKKSKHYRQGVQARGRKISLWLGSMVASLIFFIIFIGDGNAKAHPDIRPLDKPAILDYQTGQSSSALRFEVSPGARVRATASGWVRQIKYDPYQQAYFLEIAHPSSIHTYYAHLGQTLIKKGEKVRKGQVIAFTKKTKESKPTYLDYWISFDKKPVNPLEYFID